MPAQCPGRPRSAWFKQTDTENSLLIPGPRPPHKISRARLLGFRMGRLALLLCALAAGSSLLVGGVRAAKPKAACCSVPGCRACDRNDATACAACLRGYTLNGCGGCGERGAGYTGQLWVVGARGVTWARSRARRDAPRQMVAANGAAARNAAQRGAISAPAACGGRAVSPRAPKAC